MKEILIQELMTKDVHHLSPDAELSEAIRTMRDRHCSCVVIARKDGPIGIITERDMISILAGVNDNPHILTSKVTKIMSAPPVTINETDSLFEALVVAKAEKVRHLPVVDTNGRLVGIVTQSDLVKAHFHVYERQREIIDKAINERTEALLKANEELKGMTLEDPLLGIGNRRAMEVDLQHTHASAARYGFQYSILFIDIDHFKLYNDHYGHQAGDEALKRIADHIKTRIREADRVYRYGGEEFLVLLPETNIEGAEIIARDLVEDLKVRNLPHCKSPENILTVSVGVESYAPGEKRSWEDVVFVSDQRLYKAKSSGRSRAVAAG